MGAIGTESDRRDRGGVTAQGQQCFLRYYIPNAHSVIVIGNGNAAAIGAEGGNKTICRMAGESQQRFAGCHVPNVGSVATAPSDDLGAIGAEDGFAAGEGEQFFTRHSIQ